MKIYLESMGIFDLSKVSSAFDGIEGLRKIENQKFDIIFLDQNMPKKNGLEMLKHTPKHLLNQIIMD